MNHVSVTLRNNQVHNFQVAGEWVKLDTRWDARFITVVHTREDGLKNVVKFAIDEVVVISSSEI